MKLNQLKQRIAQVTIVVKCYDEAIEFYTKKLNFTLLEDTQLNENKRWVTVAPLGAKECCLLLAKATSDKQSKSIGNQTGGRVGFFLFTDDFRRDYNQMVERKVKFITEPSVTNYGTVAIFEDLYGNLWDFIEPSKRTR